jgi:hypothetical protein
MNRDDLCQNLAGWIKKRIKGRNSLKIKILGILKD